MKAILLFLLFFSSCRSTDPITSLSGQQMTMSWEVKVADRLTSKERAELEKCILREFATIDKVYNNWNPFSEISQLRHLKAGEKAPLSKELSLFLHEVDRLVKVTEGRFDPTIEPLQKLYKSAFVRGILPPPDKLGPLKEAIGWHKIHFDDHFFWKDHDHTALDLSGIAKGYCVDRIAEKVLSLGYSGVYVEWGGEVKAMGSHKNGAPWRIAIRGAEVVSLSDLAIATSGNCYQRWTIDGVTYTHIMNPETQKPLIVSQSAIPSAAVMSASCAEADALATALMLFDSREEAALWIKKHNLHAWLIE